MISLGQNATSAPQVGRATAQDTASGVVMITSGQVALEMSKLKCIRFATAIIERYRRREASVEEAMIETCLASVSTRRIEDVSEVLWDISVSVSSVSNLDDRALGSVEERRGRPPTHVYLYVFVDGIYLKRSWGGNLSLTVPEGRIRH